jgi:hypothetical protein
MVLKARDYGFIGLKLKGLIFHESGNQGARGMNIHRLGREGCEKRISAGG